MVDHNFYSYLGASNYGLVVFLDLDRFGECSLKLGFQRYSPNQITGFLTQELLHYIRQYHAVHIWGINEKEGTEEAILIFYQDIGEVVGLFDKLREKIQKIAKELDVPTSLSVGIAYGPIHNIKPIQHHRKRDFKKDPTRYLAYKALKEAKKRGGNLIITY